MPITSQQYPVNLILEGRRCLVVGGGSVAARKAEGLLACGATVHLVAAQVGAEVRGLASARAWSGGSGVVTAGGEPPAQFDQEARLSWDERAYRSSDLTGCCLVVAATDDQGANRRVAADAEAAGVWVNVADDPDACMFTLPAVLRSGPVMVAVSTAGHSPALAGWLRTRLASEVGPEYGVLAELAAEARDVLRAAGRSTEGLDWQSAFDSDMLSAIRAGRLGQARERLRACLSLS